MLEVVFFFVIVAAITSTVTSVINNWNRDPLNNRKTFRRPKGAQFKTYYKINEKLPVESFEDQMASGMFAEAREIYVTAFCREGSVVRVTATMGTTHRCQNSDDILGWREHAIRLACDEIRQYHNHPNCFGRKSPSHTDRLSHSELVRLTKGTLMPIRSFLVYANYFRGWEIVEYSDSIRSRLIRSSEA